MLIDQFYSVQFIPCLTMITVWFATSTKKDRCISVKYKIKHGFAIYIMQRTMILCSAVKLHR